MDESLTTHTDNSLITVHALPPIITVEQKDVKIEGLAGPDFHYFLLG